MKKGIALTIAIVAIVVVSILAYSLFSPKKETITVSGAWALYLLMVKWAEEYQKIHPEVRIDVSAGGAGKGMADALAGLSDIGMVSRKIYQEEIDRGAFWVSVTKDAVVPTVNANNPVLQNLLNKGVTKQTFIDIFITGNVATWGQVVGTNAPDVIHVYTRSDACGAAQTWAEWLNSTQEDLTANPHATGVYGDPGVATAVQGDPLGIGYNNINYAYDPSTKLPVAGIRVVPLDLNGNGTIDENEDFYDNRTAITQAIANEAYPSPPARDLHLVTKNEFTGVAKDFVKWILTDGQQYVSETGYIQLSEEKLQEELAKLG